MNGGYNDQAALRQVVEALHKHRGRASQPDLVETAGLPRTTVVETVKELSDQDVVSVSTRRSRQAGRPPQEVALESGKRVVIGVDLGHSHLRVGVSDFVGNWLTERPAELPVSEEADDYARIAAAADLVRQQLAKAERNAGDVVGVGIAVSGPVNQRTGRVPAQPGVQSDFERVDPRMDLSEQLRVDPNKFVVGNDATLGALAEQRRGALRSVSEGLYLKWSTGVGACAVVGGRVYSGATGIAGELGHSVVPWPDTDDLPTCRRCTLPGCAESLAGAEAIVRYTRANLEQARRDRSDPVIDNAMAALAQTGRSAVLEFAVGLEALSGGDNGRPDPRQQAAEAAIEKAAGYLGQALGPAVNLLNPQLIVVGGMIGHQVPFRVWGNPLRRALDQTTMPAARLVARIEPGQLAGESAVRGAALLAVEQGLAQLAASA